MTPVEEIRRVAALMRKRAMAATPSPWTLWDRGVGWEIPELPECHDGTTFYRPDAEHIASWHPGVALAVADWLDLVVNLLGQGFDPNAETTAALAVARAYLGGAP